MSQLADEPIAEPLRPLERHVQLETDAFCDCGYNLHGQIVTRDERLGFMVCRCPECGRWHPAGHGAAARSQWLSRLAAALLVVWSIFILWVTIGIMFTAGGLQMATLEVMTFRGTVTADNRPVQHRAQANGQYALTYLDTNQVVPPPAQMNLRMVRALQPQSDDYNSRYQANRRFERNLVLACSAGLGWLTGVLAAIFLWHWRKRNYVWVAVVIVIPAIFIISIVSTIEEYDVIRNWAISRVAMIAGFQAVFILLGVWMGRPIGRFIARLLIPPRPRQFLGFLWRADGKTPPFELKSAHR